MSGRDWLRSFVVFRTGDIISCHVWMDGGSKCSREFAIRVPPREGDGCSHRSVADYIEAALSHLKEHHLKEYADETASARYGAVVDYWSGGVSDPASPSAAPDGVELHSDTATDPEGR